MNRPLPPRRLALLTLTAAICLSSFVFASRAMAQRPDDPFAADTADEAPSTVAPDDTDATDQPAAEEIVETDPVVLAIRDSNPQSAEELLRAVEALLNIRRLDEGGKYFDKFVALNLDDAGQARLVRRFGPALFIRIARAKGLSPDAERVALQALEASRKAAEDPARVEALVRQLADPARRASAMSGLREARLAAFGPSITVLADPQQKDLHRPVQSALRTLGREATAPLVATLDSQNPYLMQRTVEVLAAADDPDAIPALVRVAYAPQYPQEVQDVARAALVGHSGRIPSREAALKFLEKEFIRHFEDTLREQSEEVAVWSWDADHRLPVAMQVTRSDVVRREAYETAAALVAIEPDNARYLRWQLAAGFERDQAAANVLQEEQALSKEVEDLATDAGPQAVNDALGFCLTVGRRAGAAAAARLLGEIGDPTLLAPGDRPSTPLIDALRSPDANVQFAAAETIMRMNPPSPFAGSSSFQEALTFILTSAAGRRVLVADPVLQEGRSLAGLLQELGWEGEVATTGSAAIRRVANSPDFDFILISDAIADPAATELVQLLRHTPGSIKIPVALFCREQNYGRLESQLAGTDPRLVVVPRPHDLQAMQYAVQQLLTVPGRQLPAIEERMRRAELVLDWIQLTVNSPNAAMYELLQMEDALTRLLYSSGLSAKAGRVLGELGAHSAQKRLVDMASQTTIPIAVRQAAAEGFAAAVKRRGVMLESQQILEQYDRYNASAVLDQETQKILSFILDVMEAPSRGAEVTGDGETGTGGP